MASRVILRCRQHCAVVYGISDGCTVWASQVGITSGGLQRVQKQAGWGMQLVAGVPSSPPVQHIVWTQRVPAPCTPTHTSPDLTQHRACPCVSGPYAAANVALFEWGDPQEEDAQSGGAANWWVACLPACLHTCWLAGCMLCCAACMLACPGLGCRLIWSTTPRPAELLMLCFDSI